MARRARIAALASALGVALATAWSAAPAALGHNGLGIKPIFTTPVGLVVSDGTAPVTFAWTSLETHPATSYTFSYQAAGIPPTPGAALHLRHGTPFATVPADALELGFAWDLADVPSGAWHVYAEFEEPPFCTDMELAPTLVVVRRPGDPAPLGVMVTEPFDESVTVDASATVGLRAIGEGPLTVTIEAGDLIRDPDFPDDQLCVELIWQSTRTVATDLALVADDAAGEDRWRLDYTWDTSDVPVGAYLLRVTVTDAGGAEATAYAHRWINVSRGGGSFGDRDPFADTSGGDPDASDVVAEGAREDEGGGGDDGCRGAGGQLPWPLAVLSALLAWRQRRRRHVQT